MLWAPSYPLPCSTRFSDAGAVVRLSSGRAFRSHRRGLTFTGVQAQVQIQDPEESLHRYDPSASHGYPSSLDFAPEEPRMSGGGSDTWGGQMTVGGPQASGSDGPKGQANEVQELRQVKLDTQAALRAVSDPPLPSNVEETLDPAVATTPFQFSPSTVDRRIYDGVERSRRDISAKLRVTLEYQRFLERSLSARNKEIAAAKDMLLDVGAELRRLSELAKSAAASAAYGVDRSEAIARSQKMLERMEDLLKAFDAKAEQMDRLVVRYVPISWYGVANEVRVMGDFDDWTHGLRLSADSQDTVYTEFKGDLPLLPGEYKVKFVVDGNWRCVEGFDMVTDAEGVTNNVLVVV